MKREPTFYLSLAACGLAACCLWQTITVREELDSLSRDMRNLNHTMQDQVSSIYSTVNRALEEEASILAEEDFTFGQVDIETPFISYSGLCGNVASGVASFAIEEGLVNAQEPYKRMDQVVFEPELVVRKT